MVSTDTKSSLSKQLEAFKDQQLADDGDVV